MRIVLAIVILQSILVGCTSSITLDRVNSAEDVQEGGRFAETFYRLLISQQRDSACALFGGSLDQSDCQELTGQLLEMHGSVHRLEDVVVTSSVLVDENGSVQSKEYTINSIVRYEQRLCKEQLVVRSKGSQPLRIIGYHSDLHSDTKSAMLQNVTFGLSPF